MKPRSGFVGLGIMGKGMAKTLLQAGYELTVYNRTRKKAEELVKLGAKVVPKRPQMRRVAMMSSLRC